MSVPLTGWEARGAYSTRAEETALLARINTETMAVVSAVGESVEGRTIRQVAIGNPNGPTMMVTACQHANERSARESALIWIRDLAYSTDPEVLSYLVSHRVVVIPTVNIDKIQGSTTRTNANGVDINRDWFTMSQPETRAVKQAINQVNPNLLMDLHEWFSNPLDTDWAPGFSDDGVTSQAVYDLTAAFVTHVGGALTAAGYSYQKYPHSSLGTLRSAGAVMHIPTVLCEAVRDSARPTDRRIAMTLLELDTARQWHATNSAALTSARDQSRADAAAGVLPLMIPTGNPGWKQIHDPGLYVLPPLGVLPQPLAGLWQITADGRNVSTLQVSRTAVGLFFDPRSTAYVAGGPWVPEGEGTPGREPLGLGVVVKQDGIVRNVTGVLVKQDGIVRNV